MTTRHHDLTEGGMVRRMFGLAVPMVAGTFAMTAFQLADTWFVARLGTGPLAAMGFTFPVVMVTGCVSMALGTGATAIVSQALGEGDTRRAARVATDCLVLAFLIVTALGLIGIAVMDPLFRSMGAKDDVQPFIRSYMTVWFLAAGPCFLAMPANSILRAAGDTRLPSAIMIAGAGANCLLDPLLIFGWGPIPGTGMQGAAVATAWSRALTVLLAFLVLRRRYGLLARPTWRIGVLLASWRQVMHIAGPALVSYLLHPVSLLVITRVVAGFGTAAVAAFGAGGRIEMFAYLVPMALGISLVPLVGQNYGGGRYDRVAECRRYSERFAMLWGALIALAFFLGAPYLAGLFARDDATRQALVLYLRIMPFGYGMREVLRYVTLMLNAISRPVASLGLNALYLIALNVPFAVVGARLGGLAGVFVGVVLAGNAGGLAALLYSHRRMTPEALGRGADRRAAPG
ncbi:MAG: MATE family efflux transporter [Lentisphaeria bacterium]|nr:MATE family efflux transporter [Lentisphaeria bacterium]